MTRVDTDDHQHTLSELKDKMASVHAMCIHQISGLLDDHKEVTPYLRFNSAQLYQQYFLKVGLFVIWSGPKTDSTYLR